MPADRPKPTYSTPAQRSRVTNGRAMFVSGDGRGPWARRRRDPKSTIYINFLPLINSGKVRLLGNKRLVNQLIGLERRTSRAGRDSIDHAPGGHDDIANAAAGALLLATAKLPKMRAGAIDSDGFVHWRDEEPRNHSRIRWITVDKDGNEVRR